MRLLIISNMGPLRCDPVKNRFIDHQYRQLKSTEPFDFIDYFYLKPFPLLPSSTLLKYGWFFLSFVFKYLLSFKKLDIIHVHYYYPTIFLAVLYKLIFRQNTKIVVTFHGSDIYDFLPQNKLYRWCFGFVEDAIFVTPGLKKGFPLSLPRSHVLCAGVQDAFKPPDEHKQGQKQYFDFIFVGHLHPCKGISRLLSLLDSDGAALSLGIVGTGYDGIDAAVKASKHNITYIPSATSEELQVLYYQSRFLLNLSEDESFGLVITEAMTSGTPVIATKTDGSDEQITNGLNGYIVPNDEQWLADNLSAYLHRKLDLDDADYQQLVEEGIKSSDGYKLSAVCQALYQIYLENIDR